MSSSFLASLRVAVLHQGGPIQAMGGVTKPMKPGGYSDSGADIAFNLRAKGIDVVTPNCDPIPTADKDWSFPDNVENVRDAVINNGANVLWANTTLHSAHAIVQLRKDLEDHQVRMIGHCPFDTEKFEDKEWMNGWLASHAELANSFPFSLRIKKGDSLEKVVLPAVCKPIRGRGSHGVTLVKSPEELELASYLAGEEITITVMPPGDYTNVGHKNDYWSLPVVTRFNHLKGIAPYNGIVAVTANSRALSAAEHDVDPSYSAAQRKCEIVARLSKATAPIRVDCRRPKDGEDFFLFDVNMKPNATGPGRPGRETQASLTTMAAEAIGWNYPEFIVNILKQARLVSEVLPKS